MNKRILLLTITVLSSISALAQDYFYGSVTFKNYASQPAPAQQLYDSIRFSYFTNGITQSQYYYSNPTLIFPTEIVELDTTCYIQYKDKPNVLLQDKRIDGNTFSVRATNEYLDILGYRCQKFVVERKIDSSYTMITYHWLAQTLKLATDKYRNKLLNQVPLKHERIKLYKNGKVAYVDIREAVSIKRDDLAFDLNQLVRGKSIQPNSYNAIKQEFKIGDKVNF